RGVRQHLARPDRGREGPAEDAEEGKDPRRARRLRPRAAAEEPSAAQARERHAFAAPRLRARRQLPHLLRRLGGERPPLDGGHAAARDQALARALAADIAVALVALLHAYFLVLEMFLWDKPYGRRVFGLTPEFSQASKSLAANQGLYNGFLVAGLAWGLCA